MKNNERIYVRSFYAETHEDDYENGESLSMGSSWDSDTMQFKNHPAGYATVEDALKAVCAANSFAFRTGDWTSYGKDMGEEFGRFDGAFTVNADNAEASPTEIAEWKAKQRKLYSCYIVVNLEVREIRELAEDEALSFGKKHQKNIIKAMNKIGYADVVVNKTITRADVDKAMQVLVDNGIDEDEAEAVMQAVGYALLNAELFETVVKR